MTIQTTTLAIRRSGIRAAFAGVAAVTLAPVTIVTSAIFTNFDPIMVGVSTVALAALAGPTIANWLGRERTRTNQKGPEQRPS